MKNDTVVWKPAHYFGLRHQITIWLLSTCPAIRWPIQAPDVQQFNCLLSFVLPTSQYFVIRIK
jgi:hypothetical protein